MAALPGRQVEGEEKQWRWRRVVLRRGIELHWLVPIAAAREIEGEGETERGGVREEP